MISTIAGIYSKKPDGSPNKLIAEGDWVSIRVHENSITMKDGTSYSLDKFYLISYDRVSNTYYEYVKNCHNKYTFRQIQINGR